MISSKSKTGELQEFTAFITMVIVLILRCSLPLPYLADNEATFDLLHCCCIVNITQLGHN